jgi:hypothetical protein
VVVELLVMLTNTEHVAVPVRHCVSVYESGEGLTAVHDTRVDVAEIRLYVGVPGASGNVVKVDDECGVPSPVALVPRTLYVYSVPAVSPVAGYDVTVSPVCCVQDPPVQYTSL